MDAPDRHNVQRDKRTNGRVSLSVCVLDGVLTLKLLPCLANSQNRPAITCINYYLASTVVSADFVSTCPRHCCWQALLGWSTFQGDVRNIFVSNGDSRCQIYDTLLLILYSWKGGHIPPKASILRSILTPPPPP